MQASKLKQTTRMNELRLRPSQKGWKKVAFACWERIGRFRCWSVDRKKNIFVLTPGKPNDDAAMNGVGDTQKKSAMSTFLLCPLGAVRVFTGVMLFLRSLYLHIIPGGFAAAIDEISIQLIDKVDSLVDEKLIRVVV